MRSRRQYNIENLIQFDEMTPEQHRELSAKGGRASGETRRKKKALQDSFYNIMEQHAVAEGFIEDLAEFEKWKKQRAKARTKRKRTPVKMRKKTVK